MKSLSILISVGLLAILLNLSPADNNRSNAGDTTGISEGDGLTGHYYQGYAIADSPKIINFTNLTEAFTRTDTVIDFWNGSQYYSYQPVPGYANYYSVEWKGYIYIGQTGQYGFGTISDDGSQLFIDSVLVVDNWETQWYDWEDNLGESDSSGAPYTPLILDSGFHEISVRFYENASYDGIEVWWLTAGFDTSDIPYYGTHFHGTPPTFNANTNWEIIPKRVLYTYPDTTTVIESFFDKNQIPDSPYLRQNYPNPFNPVTVISWQLAVSSQVKVTVYSTSGQKIETLVSARQNPGHHQVRWDASGLASGVYYYKLETSTGFSQTKKLVLIK